MIVRTYQTEVRQRISPSPVAPERKKARVQFKWTDSDIETLDRLRADGLSFARIAKKMGRTRNSLIGFDWRRRRG